MLLVKRAKAFHVGDEAAFTPDGRLYEADELARSFNQLARTAKAQQKDLALKERRQAAFVSDVAHELRTPLTAIRGNAEMLLDPDLPPEMHEKFLSIIIGESERLSRLTNDLLTLKRIEKRAGKKIPYDLKAENLLVPPVSAKSSPAEVWKGKYLRTTVALTIIYFAGNFSIYGVNAWLPALMLEATGGAVTASYMLAMAQNAASVVANCTTGFISEAMGRKRNLVFGYALSVVACLIVSQVVKLPAETSFWPYLIAFVFMGFSLNYAITAAQPMMSESYPTEFRNSGVATIVALGKSAGIFSPIILGGLKAAGWEFSPLIMLLALPMVFGFLATLVLPKGAKGMNIDDIADEAAEVKA